jgi:Fe-S cluster assembly protein SufD
MESLTDKSNLVQQIQTAFTKEGLDSDVRRQEALDLFLLTGFPGPKTEEYKFIPIARVIEKQIAEKDHSKEIAKTSPVNVAEKLVCNVIAFVNGKYWPERSVIIEKELIITSSGNENVSKDNDPFDLLNRAFAHEVVQINVGANLSLQHPVAFVYYMDSPQFSFTHPRWRFTIGTNSNVSVMEYVVGGGSFHNKQSVIEVGENARLEYTIIQNGSSDIQVTNSVVHLSSSARASCFTFTFDGRLIRNNLTLTVDGEGVDAHLYGLYLLSKNTIADNHTVVDHQKPNSYSNELYKGVMEENSKGIFNGKIFVRPYAQKTNAFQSNRNILLSDTATINTKPQLEIWADDVKCSHGCTSGQLDEEALFYLRSRGISKDLAKGMLLYAFASEVLASMKNETIKAFVDGLVSERLHKNF